MHEKLCVTSQWVPNTTLNNLSEKEINTQKEKIKKLETQKEVKLLVEYLCELNFFKISVPKMIK